MTKLLLLIALIFSMGCTTMGAMMKGMGDGLTKSSNSTQSKNVNCITTGSAGFYNTTCQ